MIERHKESATYRANVAAHVLLPAATRVRQRTTLIGCWLIRWHSNASTSSGVVGARRTGSRQSDMVCTRRQWPAASVAPVQPPRPGRQHKLQLTALDDSGIDSRKQRTLAYVSITVLSIQCKTTVSARLQLLVMQTLIWLQSMHMQHS